MNPNFHLSWNFIFSSAEKILHKTDNKITQKALSLNKQQSIQYCTGTYAQKMPKHISCWSFDPPVNQFAQAGTFSLRFQNLLEIIGEGKKLSPFASCLSVCHLPQLLPGDYTG